MLPRLPPSVKLTHCTRQGSRGLATYVACCRGRCRRARPCCSVHTSGAQHEAELCEFTTTVHHALMLPRHQHHVPCHSLGLVEERPEAPVMTLMASSSTPMPLTSVAPTTRCSLAVPPPDSATGSATSCASGSRATALCFKVL